ncbi:MAG: nascent polypeptide-associated complex protein [Candidatus Aenigmarchaeota archaeon]|nr:nascent polypeptide-associated complex protein [Candidatus Aenigmarchaeota archaeon]
MKINPKQLEKIAKQMGMQASEIAAEQVIIRTADKDIIINSPQVTRLNMMGQETYQVVGQAHAEARKNPEALRQADVSLIMQQTGASKEQAEAALAGCNSDIAEAILRLKKS